MTAKQMLDELSVWLTMWESNCVQETLSNNAFNDMKSACVYHENKQRVYAIRHMQDKLKELREKANGS